MDATRVLVYQWFDFLGKKGLARSKEADDTKGANRLAHPSYPANGAVSLRLSRFRFLHAQSPFCGAVSLERWRFPWNVFWRNA